MYEPEVTRLFERTLRGGMVVVDVGAYIGYYTVLASRLVGASGRIYAFEPNPLAVEYLKRNIEGNSCRNVVAIAMAVLDKSERAHLVSDPAGPESFIVRADTTGVQSLDVPTVSLDEFAEGEGWPAIDLVKMDIEGSEVPALRGMRRLSDRSSKLQLIVEYNPPAMARAGLARDSLRDVLVELGFRRCYVIERGMQLVEGDILPSVNAVSNLFLTKSL
jgi:FkbM family methyltransferase